MSPHWKLSAKSVRHLLGTHAGEIEESFVHEGIQQQRCCTAALPNPFSRGHDQLFRSVEDTITGGHVPGSKNGNNSLVDI